MSFLRNLFGKKLSTDSSGNTLGEHRSSQEQSHTVDQNLNKPDVKDSKITILEDNLSFKMVDFFKEYKYLIELGLASFPHDINSMKFYRITAKNQSLIKPENGLVLRNARAMCSGKIQGLGCKGSVNVVHSFQASPDGHLLLQMKGVLDSYSKCLASCSCGTSFMVYADANVGKPGECYLAIVTVSQPKTLLPIVPFFNTDGVAVVQF